MLRALRVAALGAALMLHVGCAGGERERRDASVPAVTVEDADLGSDAAQQDAEAGATDADTALDAGEEAASDAASQTALAHDASDAAQGGDATGASPGALRANWHTFHGSLDEHDRVAALALAPDDSVYVVGKSERDWSGPNGQAPLAPYAGSAGVYVLKLSAEGAYQWHGFYAGHAWDYPSSAVVGADGNLYVAGTAEGAWTSPGGKAPLHAYAGGRDILVFSLRPDGGFRWHTYAGGAPPELNDSAGNEYVHALATDANGALYVAGEALAHFKGPGGVAPIRGESLALGGLTSECFVLKLNQDGAYVWHTLLGGGPRDSCNGIDVDAQGQIFLTGTSFGPWLVGSRPLHDHANAGGNVQTEQEDIFVASLQPDGRPAWHTFFGSTNIDIGESIRVGLDGALYVSTRSTGVWTGPSGQAPLYDGYAERDANLRSGTQAAADSGYQVGVIKLSKAGSYQWQARLGDSLTKSSLAFEHGRVLLSGTAALGWKGPAGQPPLLPHAPPGMDSYASSGMLVSLDAQGTYAWHSFTGPAENVDLTAVAVDSRGQIVAGGMGSHDWTLNGRAPLHAHAGMLQDALVMKLNAP